MTEQLQDYFRPEFKRYKRKQPPPSFQDVIDVENARFKGKLIKRDVVNQKYLSHETCQNASYLGLKPPHLWQCYEAPGFPGFQFIRNPFLPGVQRYWVKRCVDDFPHKPNITNLDAHSQYSKPESPCEVTRSKCSSMMKQEKTVMDQLRWVTLGYHYDWNEKAYHQELYTPFPDDLGTLSAFVAAVLGHANFLSQAAIVNFYHMDSTLGGHTDHSEFDLSAPLISYSIGHSAIFLLGGQTKATKPLAIHLRSGDIIIMGGASRLAYHAVPRIMYASEDGQLPDCFNLSGDEPCCDVDNDDTKSGKDNPAEAKAACGCTNEDEGEMFDCLNATRMHVDSKEDHGKSEDSTGHSNASDQCKLSSDRLAKTKPNITTESSVGQQCSSDNGKDSTDNSVSTECQAVATTDPGLHDKKSGSFQLICALITRSLAVLSKSSEWKPYKQYLRNSRINISVRQVTGSGKGFPSIEGSATDMDTGAVYGNEKKRIKVDDM